MTQCAKPSPPGWRLSPVPVPPTWHLSLFRTSVHIAPRASSLVWDAPCLSLMSLQCLTGASVVCTPCSYCPLYILGSSSQLFLHQGPQGGERVHEEEGPQKKWPLHALPMPWVFQLCLAEDWEVAGGARGGGRAAAVVLNNQCGTSQPFSLAPCSFSWPGEGGLGVLKLQPLEKPHIRGVRSCSSGVILTDVGNCDRLQSHFYFGRGRLEQASRHQAGHPIFSDKGHSWRPSSPSLGSCWLPFPQHKWARPPKAPKEAWDT